MNNSGNDVHNNELRIEKKTVLIVDDEQPIADCLASRCRSIGLNVRMASNAMKAIEAMEYELPHLMILDNDMPLGDGNLFLDVLDNEDAHRHIPAIVLCKTSDLSSVRRVQSIPAYYVHKSPRSWSRIEMFTYELVDLVPDFSNESAGMNNFSTDIL